MDTNKTLTEQVIGCAFEVCNTLGAGFLESVYENALCAELSIQNIGFRQQEPIQVRYKEQIVGNYVADLIVEDKLLVELKALTRIAGVHEAQIMNYLKATGLTVGLILKFGSQKLGIKRIVHNYNDLEVI